MIHSREKKIRRQDIAREEPTKKVRKNDRKGCVVHPGIYISQRCNVDDFPTKVVLSEMDQKEKMIRSDLKRKAPQRDSRK